MLATSGQPFDSDRHLFEVKWDGIRAVTMVDGDGVRLLSRRGSDLTGTYPELAVLRRLPPGTVVDGEIVVLNEGRPDFEFALRRDRRGAGGADGSAQPALYLIFDLMYLGYEPAVELPLHERRAPLAELVGACGSSHVAFSEGIVGAGVQFYREVCDRAMEGVMAKRLDSRYLPGRRSDAWVKVKRRISYHCLVLGYLDKEGRDFQSLAVATEREPGAGLRYAGRVGSGFNAAERAELNTLLRRHRSAQPLLPLPAERAARDQLDQACWVEPVLFCVVSCVEMTSGGMLRAPVFERLVREGEE
jgi:DNA ligase D-like protein (predicted ligase)